MTVPAVPDAAGLVVRAYRFALDPTVVQVQQLRSHCGAARFAFDHLLAAVKVNLDQRSAERSYGIAEQDLTRRWTGRPMGCASPGTGSRTRRRRGGR